MKPTEKNSVKIVFVGDGDVGKTSLLITYTQNAFPTEYIPTASFNNYGHQVSVTTDGVSKTVDPVFFDTAGQEDWDRFRALAYPQTDIFVIVFAVDNPDSLVNVGERWMPELTRHGPGTPMILVGAKTDPRTDEDTVKRLERTKQRPVTYKDGVAMANKIGAKQYLECSAVTQDGLRDVFSEVLKEHFKSEATKANAGTCSSILCWKGGEPGQYEIGGNSTE